jgi:hypothetical protein
LIVKELLGLHRSSFLLGDAVEYLRTVRPRFDIVMCSGVLYHMADPLTLIAEISKATDQCFMWTHYYHPERHPQPFKPQPAAMDDLEVTYWTHTYGDLRHEFWGGIAPTTSWMAREDILRAFARVGLSKIEVIKEDFDHPGGPAFTFVASRP